MGKDSKIAWTTDSFNPWHGCSPVSPACDRCYARAFARRMGLDIWGPDKPRRFFDARHWAEPVRWNAQAQREGRRRRVFCGSMCDVFEDRRDLDPWRERLWRLIEETPWLDWLLLTKRPEGFAPMLPEAWRSDPRPNVWLGVTAEDQENADGRIPILVSTPAWMRFVSCEPMLGPIDLSDFLAEFYGGDEGDEEETYLVPGLDMCIAGGESGPGARRMDLAWARSLRDQCSDAGVPFFMKQLGSALAREMGLRARAGEDPAEWPEDLRIRQFPEERSS